MDYKFSVGQRVCYEYGLRFGEIESMVPGNGSIEWYYVAWDDGEVSRHTRDELQAV